MKDVTSQRNIHVSGRHRAITGPRSRNLRLLPGPSHKKQPASLVNVSWLGLEPS